MCNSRKFYSRIAIHARGTSPDCLWTRNSDLPRLRTRITMNGKKGYRNVGKENDEEDNGRCKDELPTMNERMMRKRV